MIKYITVKDIKLGVQVTKKWFRYTILIMWYVDGKAVEMKKVRRFFGVRTYLKTLINRELNLGIELDEIQIYNYTRKDLEFQDTKYYALSSSFIKYFDR